MSKIKLLVIDDEQEFAEALAERLQIRQFDARCALSAEEAVAIIGEGWVPEAVLVDLKMPGVDGLKTLEILKKMSPSIHVIMITGHGSTSSGIEGMKRGLCDYLMKPIDIEDISAKIIDCCTKG